MDAPGRRRDRQSSAVHALREPSLERLDVSRRDVLGRPLAERREQMDLDDRSVVADRRRLPTTILSDVAQVLRSGMGEGRAAPHHPGQRSPASLVERSPQPVLGRSHGEVPSRRPALFSPCRPEPLLRLAGRTPLPPRITPIWGHIWDILLRRPHQLRRKKARCPAIPPWPGQDSNLRATDYESAALTN
jgi:hypothetical protein